MTEAVSNRDASVRFHRELYSRGGIDQAVGLFAELARFEIAEVGDHYVVEIREVDANVEGDVVAEFCNFALAHSANGERANT